MEQKEEMFIKFDQIAQTITETKELKNTRNAKVFINDLTMEMINRHLQKVLNKETKEQLLIPSSIRWVYGQMVLPQKDSDISNIEITFEPLELKVGFREIDNFRVIQKVFEELMSKFDGFDAEQRDMTYEKLINNRKQVEIMNERAEYYL